MTKLTKIAIQGTITTTSPLNITTYREKNDRRPDYGIPTLSVNQPGGGAITLPIIPGYNFKGAMRRNSNTLLYYALEDAGLAHELDLESYYLNAIGGLKGAEKEDTKNLLNIRRLREASPIVGLYGAATPHFMQGCMSVGIATAQEGFFSFYSEAGIRQDDIRRTPQILDRLAPGAVDQYAAYVSESKALRAQRDNIEKLERNIFKARKSKSASEVAAISDELNAANEDFANLKDSSENVTAQIMRPIFRKGVSAGTQFDQSIYLDNPTPAEFGLFLRTLRHFATDCRLGAQKNNGFGLFRGLWTIDSVDPRTLKRERLGTIEIDMLEDKSELTHPLVVEALAAWDACASDPKGRIAYTLEKLANKVNGDDA